MISKDQVEALIELTRRRNKQALNHSLIKSLRQVAASTSVDLYELSNKDNDREFNEANVRSAVLRLVDDPMSPGYPIAQYTGFIECIAGQKIVRQYGNDGFVTKIIFPVRGIRDVIGVLVINCDHCCGETMYMIEALTQVWDSQRYLLEMNERDRLTGLLNRQAFENLTPTIFCNLKADIADENDPGCYRCMAIIDIDKFKEINDDLGHLYGDEVLVQFAQIINRSFRSNDYLFRYGGEEFLIILNQVDLEQALQVVERFRKTVEHYIFPGIGKRTASIGLLQLRSNELPSTQIDNADKALYYAKQHGRNQVQVYEHLVGMGKLTLRKASGGEIELF